MQLNSNSQNLTLEQLPTQLPLTGARCRVISLTGGGGKTSLMYRWAACLKENGLTVITTTTTKLAASPRGDSRFVEVSTLESAMAVVEKTVSTGAQSSRPMITLVSDRPAPTGKVSGIEPQWIDLLAERFPAVFFIVEADGSAGKSLKGYLDDEPVVPASTALLIPLVGLDALGCPDVDLAAVIAGDFATRRRAGWYLYADALPCLGLVDESLGQPESALSRLVLASGVLALLWAGVAWALSA